MPTPAGRTHRPLVAVLAFAVLTSACTVGDEPDRTVTAAPAAKSAGKVSPGPDLAPGLLLPDAFGPRSIVLPAPRDSFEDGSAFAPDLAQGQGVNGESCRAAVRAAQPSFEQFYDVAAQTSVMGASVVLEVLARGGPAEDAVSELAEAAEHCPLARITWPQGGAPGTISFESVPLEALGDGSALLRYTSEVPLSDTVRTTVSTLVGAVRDGDRLLMLMSTDLGSSTSVTDAPLDVAAFTSLLGQAYETQAAALD